MGFGGLRQLWSAKGYIRLGVFFGGKFLFFLSLVHSVSV